MHRWSNVTVVWITIRSLCCGATRRRGLLREVAWWSFFSRYSTKIASTVLRKFPHYLLIEKVMSQQQTFLRACPRHHDGKTTSIDLVWRNHITVTLHTGPWTLISEKVFTFRNAWTETGSWLNILVHGVVYSDLLTALARRLRLCKKSSNIYECLFWNPLGLP